jgi:membrane protein implicated in regulation of membrane protease activity
MLITGNLFPSPLRLPLLLILSLPFFLSFPLWESASSFAVVVVVAFLVVILTLSVAEGEEPASRSRNRGGNRGGKRAPVLAFCHAQTTG